MLEGSTTEHPEPRAIPATDKHVLNKWTKTWLREGKQVWKGDRKSSCGGRKVTVYFSCSKTDGRKANEAVKWEKKKKAGEVVGKVGRKMEGRHSLGERMEGRRGSRVHSACRVSRRWQSRVEVSMSWEGQAEQAFGVLSDLFTVCKTVPFKSKHSSPSERPSFPSREFHHT